LNPTVNNYRPCGSSIGFYFPADSTVPLGFASRDIFEREIKPVITAPGGVLGALTRNLRRFDLTPYVEVREGHFAQVAPRLGYTFVFTDAMHNPEEIRQNGPLLRDFLSRGTLLACHDVTSHPENEACIRQHLPVGESFIIDSLFIAEVV
jgi:hypothetical protein